MRFRLDTATIGRVASFLVGVAGSLLSVFLLDTSWEIGLILGLLLLIAVMLFQDSLVLRDLQRVGAAMTSKVYVPVRRDLFAQVAHTKLKYYRELITDYETGVLHLSNVPECLELYVRFLASVTADNNTLLATSQVDPEKIWERGPREANERFIQRGGQVQRVFLVTSRGELSAERAADLRRELRAQEAIGVEVLVCFEDKLVNPKLIRDFLISPSDRIAMEFSIATDKTTWAGQLIVRQELVRELRAVFDQLRLLSVPLADLQL